MCEYLDIRTTNRQLGLEDDRTQVSVAEIYDDIVDELMHLNKPPNFLVSYWFCLHQDDEQSHLV
ncbi:MAG: hypothetical protein WBL95_06955 [Microcoleus sp.]